MRGSSCGSAASVDLAPRLRFTPRSKLRPQKVCIGRPGRGLGGGLRQEGLRQASDMISCARRKRWADGVEEIGTKEFDAVTTLVGKSFA